MIGSIVNCEAKRPTHVAATMWRRALVHQGGTADGGNLSE
jgi:hypothetical protein